MPDFLRNLLLRLTMKMWSKNGITLTPMPADAPVETGKSKFGGRPDVPADFVWPYYEGKNYEDKIQNRPLAFLAQLNCAELRPFDKEGLLPETGVLSFFYELESAPWGFDPADRGSARVFWFDTPALQPADFPADLSEGYRFGELTLEFASQAMLPSYEEFDYLTRGKTGLDWDEYEEYCEEHELFVPDWENAYTVLGYASLVQGECVSECEMVERRGLYCGNGDAYNALSEVERVKLQVESRKWIQLFQMGSVEEKEMELMFGDCGTVYFYIHRDDLAKRDFSRVWLILQCG